MDLPTFILPTKGKNRGTELQQFANYILAVQEQIKIKLSSRGWCYQIEGFNVIDKSQFNRTTKLINECRKKGLLAIDFVAEDKGRDLEGFWQITKESPHENLIQRIKHILTPYEHHNQDYWANEEYYPILLVEKVDLISIFEPICDEYQIQIANAKGWSSILQRANIAAQFQEFQEKYGCKPVLLYFGDHDPFGINISDSLKKNLKDIEGGTQWNPDDLVYIDAETGEEKPGVDRFGLNYDFIQKHDLMWIDNLISGSGKKPDYKNSIVKNYISKYGKRKVEANAVVPVMAKAQDLLTKTIQKYLKKDFYQNLKDKQDDITEEYKEIMEEADWTKHLTILLRNLSGFKPKEKEEEEEEEPEKEEKKEEPEKEEKKEEPSTDLSKYVGAKVALLSHPGYYIGELLDAHGTIIGFATVEMKLVDMDATEIGYYHDNGDLFFYEKRDEEEDE